MNIVNDHVLYTFNKFYFDFIKDVKKCSRTLNNIIRKHYTVVELKDTQHFNDFVTRVSESTNEKKLTDVICTKPSELFEKFADWEFLPEMKIDLIAENTPQPHHDVIKSYVYILSILCIVGQETNDTLLGIVLDVMKAIQEKNTEMFEKQIDLIIDDDICTGLRFLNEVMSNSISLDTKEVDAMASMGGIPPSLLENTTLGNLAKEISAELDLSTLSNVEKPEDFMNLNNIGSIVNKVGNKIHTKISNGELKQEDLVSEAFSFFNVLNKSAPGNPMLNNMMKSFMTGGGSQTKGTKMAVNENKLKEMAIKERLRRKLDEKGSNQQNIL